jgi:hypothetical protein
MAAKRPIGILSVVAIMALGACSHLGENWSKPGVGDRQYKLDVYACERDAGIPGIYLPWLFPQSASLFRRCMVAHGYTKERR